MLWWYDMIFHDCAPGHPYCSYPFMMATAMEKNGCYGDQWESVHIVMATVTTEIEYFSPFSCRWRDSVNRPLTHLFLACYLNPTNDQIVRSVSVYPVNLFIYWRDFYLIVWNGQNQWCTNWSPLREKTFGEWTNKMPLVTKTSFLTLWVKFKSNYFHSQLMQWGNFWAKQSLLDLALKK